MSWLDNLEGRGPNTRAGQARLARQEQQRAGSGQVGQGVSLASGRDTKINLHTRTRIGTNVGDRVYNSGAPTNPLTVVAVVGGIWFLAVTLF